MTSHNVPSRNAREGHYGGKQAMYAMVLGRTNKWEREKMMWKKYYRTHRALSLKGMRKSEEDVFGKEQ